MSRLGGSEGRQRPVEELWVDLSEATGARRVELLLALVRRHAERASYPQALPLTEAAESEAQQVGDTSLQAEVCFERGRLFFALGDYASSYRCHLDGVRHAEVALDQQLAGHGLMLAAEAFGREGAPQRSEECYRRAAGAYDEAGARLGAARARLRLARLLDGCGREDEALELLDWSRLVLREQEAADEVLELDLVRARALKRAGRTTQSKELLLSCLAAAPRVAPHLAAHCGCALGELLTQLGEVEQALAYLAQAAAAFDESNDVAGLARVDEHRALALHQAAATGAAEEALTVARSLYAVAGTDDDVERCDELRAQWNFELGQGDAEQERCLLASRNDQRAMLAAVRLAEVAARERDPKLAIHAWMTFSDRRGDLDDAGRDVHHAGWSARGGGDRAPRCRTGRRGTRLRLGGPPATG